MTSYDVIIVGARVAGAATAMLLARRGVKVLLIDRARFPSDTVSSHQVQVPGVARLHRWGLLGQLDAAGTPPTRAVRFDTGDVTLRGHFPACEGIDTLYSPRRTVLDTVLIDAARAAGADVREQFRAEELLWSDGRVTGIRGSHRSGAAVTETARLVVGADGKHSLVARAAPRPAITRNRCCHSPATPTGPGSRSLRGRSTSGPAARWRSSPPTTISSWCTWQPRWLSSDGSAPISKATTCRPSTCAATWASGRATRSGPSGCGARLTSRTPSAPAMAPAGPWWATPG
jgi:glycine/D-amino acid oxidase-like deaminating enzyme